MWEEPHFGMCQFRVAECRLRCEEILVRVTVWECGGAAAPLQLCSSFLMNPFFRFRTVLLLIVEESYTKVEFNDISIIQKEYP